MIRLKLNEKVYIAFWPKIAMQAGTEQRQLAYIVQLANLAILSLGNSTWLFLPMTLSPDYLQTLYPSCINDLNRHRLSRFKWQRNP